MAEGIATGIATNVLTQLSSTALEEFASALGVEKEVKRLQDTLTAIQDVLPHAENLQLSNNNVRSWLRRIKDAAYDAEDVIDDFNTEALRKKVARQGSIIERVRHFASSSNPIIQRIKMAHRIKEVRENLRCIKDDQSIRLDSNFQVNYGFISEGRRTHGYIPEGKVIGRDAEKERIVDLLLLDSSGLSVIPIQGMGGIGKTALAQLVYNDKKVVDSFGKDKMMWVCVSDEFDLQKITEKIIRSGTNQECPNLDMDQLQFRLRQHLGGKRYLLVLDDIWNEEVNKWEELKDLLIGGASGSTIIVTTRSERVGSIMRTTDINRLSELSEDDCWNLFKGRAFMKGQEDTDRELVEIGKDIAKKCVGVPLAAKTLGGLCYQQDKQTWEYVRDSDIWKLPEEQNGILRALKIGYYYLPFYLQQCFAYCSIFPKDYKIEKNMLIKLWIAQGFIHSSGGNQSLEEIGNVYVKVLMWRSFFQEPEMDDYDNLKQFKMHDLVHDLAQFVAGVECFMICNDKEENCPERVRHLFVNTFNPLCVISKPSNIRTLMFEFDTRISLSSIISNLKLLHLRVLVFKNNDIDHLPNSIDKLKHLRYLQIVCWKIKSLPESITNLQNLQVLKLRCEKIERLPKRFQNMINLRHIELLEKMKFSHMPSGLKELKSLETLSHFVVGKDGVGCGLNGLNGLTNLGGKLEILNLGNLKNADECRETKLKDKIKLRELRLVWKEAVEEIDIKRKEEMVDFKVLENLEPPPTLKQLVIIHYPGIKFPRWSMESSTSLRNVVEIQMWRCEKCEQLFPLGHLPSLKSLRLYFMDNLKYVEDRPDLQSGKEWFPSLRRLEIFECPNVERWFSAVEPQQEEGVVISFPCLVELGIIGGPKLKSLPLVPSSGIKELWLCGTTGDVVHSVVGVSNPTNSSSLFTSLEKLSISRCSGMESWPNWLVGSHLPSLRMLQIGCTSTLPFLPQEIQRLPALKDLKIEDYCEEALPEWMANITSSSLEEISLKYCPNLKILPEWMANFTSLEQLSLCDCPNLKILPEWVLRDNTTLELLQIDKCPHLFDRYNKETGEDRHKIAHIEITHIVYQR